MKVVPASIRRAGQLWLAGFAMAPCLAYAHPLAPNLLEITEASNGRLEVVWKEPANTPRGAEMAPELPEGCEVTKPPIVGQKGAGFIYRWEMQCAQGGLVDERIGVSGLSGSRANVLVRIHLEDGRVVRELMTGDRSELIVPTRLSSFRLATRYLSLGFRHLLSGWDHMLLLLGLLLSIANLRVLFAMITSFTLGHALTLSLAALGVVRVNGSWVEVAIAASILVLAAGIVRRPDAQARDMGDRLRPCVMAFVFGLLHGLGFAGALAEVGLPASEIPLALLSFNLGIESGQLVVIGVLGCLLFALGRLIARHPTPRWGLARPLTAHGIGTLAAYWCIERVWLLV